MLEEEAVLGQAEAIARGAKREEVDRLVRDCEQSNDITLRALANAYRMTFYFC
jgi:hypothetical protein